MNKQVYLKKLIHQESINAKIDMLREHIQLVREESEQHYINESINRISKLRLFEEESEDTSWSSPKINQQQAAELLVKAGATEKEFGPNPIGYELVVNVGDGKKDKFTFFSDKTVYSYNLMRTFGWEFKDNKIYLTNVSDESLVQLADKKDVATIDDKGKFNNISIGDSGEEPAESQGAFGVSGSTLDTIQTALDWAGLIPYIGDAIDAINAALYFYRGKYFDGFLSLLAIIPVVGSVLKLSVKGVLSATKITRLSKYLKGAWLAKSFKRKKIMQALFDDLLKSKALDAEQLKLVMKGMGGISSSLRKGKRGLSKIPFVKTKGAEDALENMAKYVDDLGISAGGSADAFAKLNKASSKQLGTAAKVTDPAVVAARDVIKSTKGVGFTKKAMNIMSLGIIPRLKKYSFFPAKTVDAINSASKTRFLRKAANTPEKAGVLWKLSPNPQQLNKKLTTTFEAFAKQSPEAAAKLKTTLGGTNTTWFKGNSLNPNLSGKQMSELLQTMSKSPELDVLAKDWRKQIANHNVDNGSFMWNMYKNDELVKLGSSQTFEALRTRLAKNFDIVWNEVQDVAEDLGWSRDDPNGVIYPLAKGIMANAMPGTYKDIKDTMYDVGETAKAVAEPVKQVFKMGANTVGVDLDQFEGYALADDDYTYQSELDNTEE